MMTTQKPKSHKTFLYVLMFLPLGLGMIVFMFFNYNPALQEELYNKRQADLCVPQRLSITSWNIAYAGLGKGVDFFYDGGRMVRSSEDAVRENLVEIISFLKKNSADFTLLQEVDIHSKRSYYQNQLDSILHYTGIENAYFALMYDCFFVPSPAFDALGRVRSGMASFGKCSAYQVVRYSYPDRGFSLTKAFMPRYGFLVSRYTTYNGKDLVLINNHNSAFDKGDLRRMELKYLVDFVSKEYENGNYVIVGGDWNQTPPNYTGRASTQAYTPYPIADSIVPKSWQWVSDVRTSSLRFCNTPYNKDSSLVSLVDFFLVSPNVEVQGITTHDLGFVNSDHNPITAIFLLK
ncbi:MAG: endonuclease/exonuclease/phosphatase family protein [Bacteroidales bacterium]